MSFGGLYLDGAKLAQANVDLHSFDITGLLNFVTALDQTKPANFTGTNDLNSLLENVDFISSKLSGVSEKLVESINRYLSIDDTFAEEYFTFLSTNQWGLDGFETAQESFYDLLQNISIKNLNTPLLVSELFCEGNAKITPGQVYIDEPDPSGAINFWSDYLDPKNFIYPRDPKTRLSLGAWPKNYKEIPTKLSDYKVYMDTFIWPAKTDNITYTSAAEHNGIDILAPVGTPIYSPVDGTLSYSEWGHTTNKGSDETAYTVSIALDNPISVKDVNVDTVFLTHMSGIRYRTNDSSQKVSKGELIGFVGNASKAADEVHFAPHLHMTMYNSEDYNDGLYTSSILDLYEVELNNPKNAGE